MGEQEGTVIVALAGNPNAGKTSLFNALTGQKQHVGNYPGVTVEKTSGLIEVGDTTVELVDLPGTYSLTAYSMEEVVARDFVLREKPRLVVDVIDSTNLERNLYLLLQLQELGVPVVGVLNMTDEAKRSGIRIDVPLLSKLLGIPLVQTVARNAEGLGKLLDTVQDVLSGKLNPVQRHLNYGRELEEQHEILIRHLEKDSAFAAKYSLHWVAIKLLEEDSNARDKVRDEHAQSKDVLQAADKAVRWVAKHFGQDAEVVVGEQRYAYIRGALKEAVVVDEALNETGHITDRVDGIVLHRLFGLPLFFGIMFAVYYLTFSLGNPLSDIVDGWVGALGAWLSGVLPSGILRDFLVSGVVGGVGGVLVFFPIVLLLFLGLSFLEDVGYMARAAFVMDRFLHVVGLHGRSFIPLMISTGCAVPGIMAARTLADRKDRIVTILVSPLIMCGAKAPVVAMVTAAFFPKHAAVLFLAIWLFGWLSSFGLALIFRKTLFKGEDSPFVMELPPYRLPTLRGVLTHVWRRSYMYVRKAGTFILAASVAIWAMLHFPTNHAIESHYHQQIQQVQQRSGSSVSQTKREKKRVHQQVTSLENELQEKLMEQSIAGRVGRAIEPVTKLAGFDWKLNIALVAGTAAKEVIISTMGVVYGAGEVDADSVQAKMSLRQKIAADSSHSWRNMLAFMLFVMIYAPCVATLAVMRSELGSLKWPLFSVVFNTIVAWLVAVATYQFTGLFS